jgi:hypothetical protein
MIDPVDHLETIISQEQEKMQLLLQQLNSAHQLSHLSKQNQYTQTPPKV